MKVCMPVKSDMGIESLLYNHFGSAPYYVVFDSETREVNTVVNDNRQHEHGQCNPLTAFKDSKPEIVVVGGIGNGAFTKLARAGVRVFKAEGKTVKDNIEALISKGLPEFNQDHTCQGHHHEHSQGNCSGHGHEHKHHHDHSHRCGETDREKEGGCCH